MGNPSHPVAIGLDVAAELVGGYRWIEHRLFELMGRWAVSSSEPAVTVHLDEVSMQHAWHAQLWVDRVPVLDRIDPDGLARPLAPVSGALLEALAEEGTDPHPENGREGESLVTDVRRLAGLYRVVLPRLIVTYDEHLRRTSPVCDAPLVRAFRLIMRDETEALLAGERLLQSLLPAIAQMDAAPETVRRLESLVIRAGVGAGLVRWAPADP